MSIGGGDIIPPIIGVGDNIPGMGWKPMFTILAAFIDISFEATDAADIFLFALLPATKNRIFRIFTAHFSYSILFMINQFMIILLIIFLPSSSSSEPSSDFPPLTEESRLVA